MKNKLATSFVINLIFLLAVSSGIGFTQEKVNQTLNEMLGEYGVEFGKSGNLPVLKDFGFIAKDKYFRNIVAQTGETRIEIEIIKPLTKNEATDYSMVKYQVVENLYGPQMIPYQGTITTTTDCPAEKKPQKTKVIIEGEERPVLLASASERYTLGVWDDTLIKQKAAFTVFYDPGKSILYRVLVFQPVGSFNLKEVLEILGSIKIASR
jgi:hypothetical protein